MQMQLNEPELFRTIYLYLIMTILNLFWLQRSFVFIVIVFLVSRQTW